MWPRRRTSRRGGLPLTWKKTGRRFRLCSFLLMPTRLFTRGEAARTAPDNRPIQPAILPEQKRRYFKLHGAVAKRKNAVAVRKKLMQDMTRAFRTEKSALTCMITNC